MSRHNQRPAFTMLELVFVIVVMGILAKFGTELFLQTYENYSRTIIVNDLDTKSEAAVQQIANRLSYRISDSVIATTGPTAAFSALENGSSADNVIEWINQDIDGWHNGSFSGIIDLADSNLTHLRSPGTTALTAGYAILFVGANVNVNTGFGWHGSTANNLYSVNSVSGNNLVMTTPFVPGNDIYEYYLVAASASALVYNSANRTIGYYDGYQPWNGEDYVTNSTAHLLVDNVKTISVQKVGDVLLVVLCLSNNDFLGEGEYSVCKTKTVF